VWRIRNITFRYTLYGALFGFMFPVFSTLADLCIQQLPLTLDSLIRVQRSTPLHWVIDTAPFFLGLFASFAGRRQDELTRLSERLKQGIQERDEAIVQLEALQASLEQQVAERTAKLEHQIEEHECLRQELIEVQQKAIQELSTPIIPVMDVPGTGSIIVMPLVGSIDSLRARDITRALLMGIQKHRAKVVILDITGVSVVDSGVADHLNRTIQAARLKGARTVVTGISDAVAETIVDLGIDWGDVETLSDLQTGLVSTLDSLGIRLVQWQSGSARM
jgi:anti-anti-sigma regulatory factor